MNKKDAPIREEDLHAYVDGAIEGPRRAQIEDYLSRHPDVATRIQGHIALRERLREQLMPIVEDPIPPELNLARMVEAHRHRRRIPWRIAASVLLAVAVGGVGGWNLRGAAGGPGAGLEALAREAATSYQVYAVDTVRPVELPAADKVQLVQWISQRLARPIALPDLAPAGYRFMGGRLIATEHGPAGLFLYDDAQGTRIAMMVRPMAKKGDLPMSAHNLAGVSGYAWADQGLGYSVTGPASAPDMHPLADEMRRQIDIRLVRG